MLVLGRKKGEALRIGQDIEVRVVRTRGGSAALGITAPPGMPIVREELLREDSKKQEANIKIAESAKEIAKSKSQTSK